LRENQYETAKYVSTKQPQLDSGVLENAFADKKDDSVLRKKIHIVGWNI